MRGDDPDKNAARLTVELEAAALRAVCRTYDGLNAAHFRRALQRPVMDWTDDGQRLGAWDPGLRQLRLNRSLLLEHGWASLVEVHEMAHQYVYDVLGVHDETAHGPAFRQVCADRGIDSAATGLPSSAVNVDEQRALDRVKKLLALAQSSNPHEAELAMAAAQRLVLKYNLEAFEPSRESHYGFRHLGTPRLRVSRAEHMAAAILREFFFVEVIWVQTWLPLEGRAGKVLEVCGVVENLELATYVHGFLLQAAERLWDAYRRQPGVRGMRYRQSFMAGVLSGFRDKLTDERRVQQQEGLIWVGDPGLSYLRRRHPRQRRTTSRTRGLAKPFAAGDAAGRGLDLGRPLRPGAAEGPRRLTSGG